MRRRISILFNFLVLAGLVISLVFGMPWKNAQALPLPTPILLVVNDAYSSNPFGRYLGEILRAEGLNAFTTLDVSQVTAGELTQHSLVVLAETSLTSTQATLFSDYVSAGGRLVAMRPDGQIASLFGLGAAAGTLNNGYVKIANAANWNGNQPGSGLTSAAMQIHGTANKYALQAGAVMIAELYSNRTTPSGYPAVAGATGGRTAAFMYDLSKNVIYTRQGNPANANLDIDGDGILRTIDLFQAAGGGAPWVDREVIPVPQVDEQQRLFARLVRQMVGGTAPLPQLWYFAGSEKTVLVSTADAHANPSSYYQNEINTFNTYGAKASFYMSAAAEPTDASVQNWRSQGFDFGIHPYAFKPDPYPPLNITSLAQGYDVSDNWFSSTFTSPKSRTVRNHQLAWLGWTDAAELAIAHGIALDTDFYHWGGWLRKPDNTWPHGYITGSGQPMKFVRADGTILSEYQLLTELVDEHLLAGFGFENLDTNSAVVVSRQMIDASQAGDYAALMTQFHVDYFSSSIGWVQGTLDYARTLGIPRWNSETYLSFTQTRHDANYTNIAWDGPSRTLTFNLEAGSGTTAGLTTLLPRFYNGLELASVSVDGVPATSVAQPVKGMDMIFVRTSAGNHSFVAVYQPALPTATPTNTPTGTLQPPAPTNTPTATSAVIPTATPTSAPFTLTQTSFDDFNAICAVPSGVYASDLNGGSLVLSGVFRDSFDGASLDPARWSSGSWSASAYNPTQASGLLTLPGGGWVRSVGTYTHATLESSATFGATPWQHIGFASDGFIGNRYFIFSTNAGDGNLYARVNNNTTEQSLNLGPIPTGTHRYRVDWQAFDATQDQAQFFIDGVLKAQFTVTNVGAVNLYYYLSNNGTLNLVADAAQVIPPYVTTGTYTSCALDAGLTNAWNTVQWDVILNAGTALAVETRTSPDTTAWSAWSPVALSGSAVVNPDRYAQYRLTFDTTNAVVSPVFNSITFLFASTLPPTATPTPGLATFTPTAMALAAATSTPTRTPTLAPGSFPSTGVLDNFNRVNGALGINWSGSVGGYAVTNNLMDVGSGGDVYWGGSLFGPDQEAFVRNVNLDSASVEVDLILKSQSATSSGALIEVWYDVVGHRAQVWTNAPGQGWVPRGADIPVTLVNGDQFGARATANGQVNVYRNGVLLGTRDVTGWTYAASGGYIGLWFISSVNSLVDDFGGGTMSALPPTATPTSTSTAIIAPPPANTATPTPTSTATIAPPPANTATPTPTSTATIAPPPADTATPTPTSTATIAPPPANTATPTPTSTATSAPPPADTATATPTATATLPPANTPTATPLPTSTSTPLPILTTGFLAPSANNPVTVNSGDNNGYETTPGNATLNDSLYAVDTNSGTGNSTSCTNVRKDRHIYYNFSMNLTGASAIQGIEVSLDGKADNTTGAPFYCVQLSWDGGVTWTAAKSTGTLGTVDTTFTLGTPVDTWGRAWTPAELANTSFRVQIVDVASSTARDFSLDWVAVNVTYR